MASKFLDLTGLDHFLDKLKLLFLPKGELYDSDTQPYIFRQTGGGVEAGTGETNKIVGGSVVWNQLTPIKDDSVSKTENGVTFTDNRDGSYTVSTDENGATAQTQIIFASPRDFVASHVYLVTGVPSTSNADNYFIYLLNSATISGGKVFKQNATASSNSRIIVKQGVTISTPVIFKPQLFDLTAMFGSTVADAIYAMEQSTAGSGVAFFKKLFPKSYYAYNSGTMRHVEGLVSHKMTGFNQWDEEWELGTFNTTTGEKLTSQSTIRSKNYIHVLPNTVYSITKPLAQIFACFYDSDYNVLQYVKESGDTATVLNKASSFNSTSRAKTFTTPNNACYMLIRYDDIATYNHDICINLSSSRNGEYEPYKKHSYKLDSSLILRGIPKIDQSGNLVYDGDIYESDGKVTRKYGIVDLGEHTWTETSMTNNRKAYSIPFSSMDGTPGGSISNTWCDSIINANYTQVLQSASTWPVGSYVFTKGSGILPTGSFGMITDDSYADATAFKAAMLGVYLVYELATPTTETAQPFTNPQEADPYGTEEYVIDTEADAKVPVGHETQYQDIFLGKMERLPDLGSNGDGEYTVKQKDSKLSLEPVTTAKTYYGTSETAAATVEKAVICPSFKSSDLVPGTAINVIFAETNSGAVASLKLNVNGTGAYNIKYVYNGAYANLPGVEYLAANQIYQFMFDGTYWVCMNMVYNTNSTAYTVYKNYGAFKTKTAMGRYKVLFQVDEEYLLSPSTNTNSTATTKTITTESFDPFGSIFYYNTTTAKAAGETVSPSTLYYECLADLRYSFNTGTTLTANKAVYVVASMQSDGLAKFADTPIAQTLPTTDDGKIYIYLGQAYDNYRVALDINHPVYAYRYGAVREVSGCSLETERLYPIIVSAIGSGQSPVGWSFANITAAEYQKVYGGLFPANIQNAKIPYLIVYSQSWGVLKFDFSMVDTNGNVVFTRDCRSNCDPQDIDVYSITLMTDGSFVGDDWQM